MSGGVVTLADSGNNFNENRAAPSALLTVTATATSTQNSADQTNLVQKGANLFLNISNIQATTTVGLNVQTKDPISGNYLTVYRVSLDAQATATAASNFTQVQLYPGVTSVAQAGLFVSNIHLGLTWRAQVSITATASQAGAAISFTVGAVPLV